MIWNNIEKDWRSVRSQVSSFPFFVFFIFLLLCLYLFWLWKLWPICELILLVLKIKLTGSFLSYPLALSLLAFYYLLFWLYLNFVFFFVLFPLSRFFIKINSERTTLDQIRRSLYVALGVTFSLVFSFTPFLLPLSFLFLFLGASYNDHKEAFSPASILPWCRDCFTIGGEKLFLLSIPILNFMFLPRYFFLRKVI